MVKTSKVDDLILKQDPKNFMHLIMDDPIMLEDEVNKGVHEITNELPYNSFANVDPYIIFLNCYTYNSPCLVEVNGCNQQTRCGIFLFDGCNLQPI